MNVEPFIFASQIIMIAGAGRLGNFTGTISVGFVTACPFTVSFLTDDLPDFIYYLPSFSRITFMTTKTSLIIELLSLLYRFITDVALFFFYFALATGSLDLTALIFRISLSFICFFNSDVIQGEPRPRTRAFLNGACSSTISRYDFFYSHNISLGLLKLYT